MSGEQEKINENPDMTNLLDDGEEKYAYFNGGKMPILHGPKKVKFDKEKYLYLVSALPENGEADSDIWEAFMNGNELRMRQYVGPNRDKLYIEMLAEYTAVVGEKTKAQGSEIDDLNID